MKKVLGFRLQVLGLIAFYAMLFLYAIPYALNPTYAQQATLSLSPASGTFNAGCGFSVNIELNTGGAKTDGVDAYLLYDQAKLSATSISPGTIFPDYPGNSVDDSIGKVVVAAISSIDNPFSGSGTFATVNFTVKPATSASLTQITFDFDANNKSKTTDSNVVANINGSVVDTLNTVVNGSYTIGTGSCSAQTTTIGGSTTGITGTSTAGTGSKVFLTGQGTASDSGEFVKTLPPAGSEKLTMTLAIVGSILTVFGILGLALL